MTRTWWLLLLIGCSGSKDEGETDTTDTPGTTETGTPADTVSVDIDAASGGTVAGGGAVLDIPAGALAGDTTITLEVGDPAGLPDEATIVGSTYDFGPDGTTFSTPATLSVPLDVAPGTGEQAVISWLDGATWVDLPSTASGTEVTAPVEHFTVFAVRLIGAPAFDCGFTACGGALEDVVWEFSGACVDDPVLEASCPGATVTSHLTGTGTFEVTSATGRFAVDIQIGGTIDYDVPGSCFPGIGSCDDLDDPKSLTDCSGDPATSCLCVKQVTETEVAAGVYQVVGTDFVTVEDGYSEPAVAPFCVSGTELKVMTDDGKLLVFTQ